MVTSSKPTRTTLAASLGCALFMAVILCLELTALARSYCTGKRAINVTVFIHGSLFTQLWPLDVKSILSGILPGTSPYVEIIKRARKNPLLWQDQALLQEGLVRIPDRVFNNFYDGCFLSEDEHKAAYLIAPAYRLFAPCDEHTRQAYYLFGHLGLLSHQYRNQVAQEELYHHLCDLLAQYHKGYWHVELTIVAHSHGGNIALNLVEAERVHRRGLHIDNLVMWGTPLHLETIAYIFNPIFKRVINCYSDGDWVQGIDKVSTKNRTCFKQLYDERLVPHWPKSFSTQIYDVRWMVNKKVDRIGHGNMWLLGREEKALVSLDPLPIMVLTPLLLDLLDAHDDSAAFDCNIVEDTQNVCLELSYHTHKECISVTDNIYAIASKARDLTHKHWKSADKSRMVLLNYQTGASLWQAVQEWFNHG